MTNPIANSAKPARSPPRFSWNHDTSVDVNQDGKFSAVGATLVSIPYGGGSSAPAAPPVRPFMSAAPIRSSNIFTAGVLPYALPCNIPDRRQS